MSLHLGQTDVIRVQALSRLLLSPLGPLDRHEWLGRIDEELMRLTGAERALSALPMRDPDAVVIRNFDPGVIPAFLEGPVDADPALALVMERRLPVIHQLMVYGDDLEDLAVYQEFLRPWGIVNSAAMNVFLPGGGLAFGGVMTGDVVDRAFQRRAHALLSLLQPSFQAGIEALIRIGHRGRELGRLLDVVADPAALYDGSGRLAHANRALVEALDSDPEGAAVWSWLSTVARGVSLVGADALEEALTAAQRMRTGWQGYRASGTIVGEAVLGGEPGVLVRVSLLDRERARADRLMARYGLTDREAEVAEHLARGETDREIAAGLGVSWHTVRTHVERVLRKLGVDSRSKVGRIVDGIDPETGEDRGGG